MNFLNNLFSKKVPYLAQPVDTAASLNEELEKYQEKVLHKFTMDRAECISRLATRDLAELKEAIHDFREELAYSKIIDGPAMCSIFEEKIYQFNAAIEILEKNHLMPVS